MTSITSGGSGSRRRFVMTYEENLNLKIANADMAASAIEIVVEPDLPSENKENCSRRFIISECPERFFLVFIRHIETKFGLIEKASGEAFFCARSDNQKKLIKLTLRNPLLKGLST